MKLTFIFFLLFPLLVCSQQKLEISKLRENFFVYTTYHDLNGTLFPANGMYVVTNDGVVIFDTPWDKTQFQPLLDSIKIKHGKDVEICISTHSHDDRTAGLNYYRSKGIATYTSEMTDSICKLKGNPRAEFTFRNDTLFTLGQYSFKMIYAGPGHTPDNIVGWFPEEKALYGGCLIKSTEAKDLGNLEDANTKEWPQTMKNLNKTTAGRKYVIPGHQSWKNKKSVEHTEKLLKAYLEKK